MTETETDLWVLEPGHVGVGLCFALDESCAPAPFSPRRGQGGKE